MTPLNLALWQMPSFLRISVVFNSLISRKKRLYAQDLADFVK